ncbi:flavocytochrome c [uncultured Parasutterella sp.]|uniref:FAD-dependent oxidoreductase n=2 Tax=uncultured Parasutterella sp. TaxID=1263098 RepID=UPI00259357B8|nr:flavocytochrome c [uncultured Parasutterella sp.]
MFNRRDFLQLSLSAASMPVFSDVYGQIGCPDESVDVLIVGAGGAGLSAAVSCHQHGYRSILVLEKAPSIGGNTLLSSGLFNSVDPERQKLAGVNDSLELFKSQILREGDFKNRPSLVSLFCTRTYETMKWLESLSMSFKSEINEGYGALFPRSHLPVEPHGTGYIKALNNYITNHRIEIRTNSRMLDILRDKETGVVSGCLVEEKNHIRTIRIKEALFLGAGGFAQNNIMCTICDPRLEGLPSTNQPLATGDALVAAIRAGAAVENLEYIECIPGKLPGQKERTVLHLFVGHMIWINREGKRFVAEDSRRDILREALLNQPDRTCFALVDKRGFEFLDKEHRDGIVRSVERGEAYTADTITELAKQLLIPAEMTVETVKKYNQAVDEGTDKEFGKLRLLQHIDTPPFFACPQVMNRHYCVGGGVRINERTEVLDFQGKKIPKLYAGGEITSGLHGTNRLGGNGIAEAIVFGREFGKVLGDKFL